MKWKNIFKETAYISSIHLTTKILGFLEKLLIAYLFGASAISDAYFFSFAVFILIFDFFNESTSPALLPAYVEARREKNEINSLRSAFTYLFIAGFLISILISLFADQIIDKFTGFPPSTSGVAGDYLRIISLGTAFVIASISTYLFINSGKKFLPASLGDLFFKVTGSIFVLYSIVDRSIGLIPLAIGILAGSMMKLTTHLVWLRKKGIKIKFDLNSKFLAVFKRSILIIVGVMFSKGRILFDNLVVSGMVVGSVTAMQLGYRVMEFSIVVLLEPFSTVLFPEFVSLVGDRKALSEKIGKSVRFLLSLFIPVSVFAFIFRHEIISILFKRGAFDERSVILTASAFSFYVLSMIFISLDFLFSKLLFALGDTKSPPLFEIFSISLHVIFVLLFKSRGIFIISLAFLINRVIKSLLLMINTKKAVTLNGKLGTSVLKVISISLVSSLISYMMFNFLKEMVSGTPLFMLSGGLFFILIVSGYAISGLISDFRSIFKS